MPKARRSRLGEQIPCDVDALAPSGSYDTPAFVRRGFYIDRPFECRTCGAPQVWTARQQKWWYEVAKGDRFSTASQCRPCRRRDREAREAAGICGDPNSYKSPGLLLARIRREVEPSLVAAGFGLSGRSRRNARSRLFYDYNRGDELLTISWDHRIGGLLAERLANADAVVETIAVVKFGSLRTAAEIEDRFAPFVAAVVGYVERSSTASESS